MYRFLEIVLNPEHIEGRKIKLMYCLFARIMLISYEVLQMLINGWDYFKSILNWLDILEVFLFLNFYLTLREHNPADDTGYMKFLYTIRTENAALILILGLNKLIFYIKVYSRLGIVIRMMTICTIELIPTILWFVLFLMLFSFSMVVLGNNCGESTEGV